MATATSPMLSIFQKGWNFNQDGPGNRLVYHLQGCNFTCPWCANPEGLEPVGTLLVNLAKLTPEVCPHGAINGSLDRAVCRKCAGRECLTVNRNEGVRSSCTRYATAVLVTEARSARSLFHSGGGVTLSGGEPTLQFAAVRTFLAALNAEGIHTALETNGSHLRLPELFSLVNTLIVDLKHPDVAAEPVVGHGLANSLVNITRAVAAERHPLIRITLIPGFNDTSSDLECFGAFFDTLPQDAFSLELLRFHEYGLSKWAACGGEYTFRPEAGGVDFETAIAFFAQRGIAMVRT